MAEELTTAMHSEFMEGEISRFDLNVMAVYGAMKRGLSKKEALEKYSMSEKTYDSNIDRVLSQP